MNEIERAIEWFTGRDKRYALSDKCAEMERIALTALREKAERSRGCEYCDFSSGDVAPNFDSADEFFIMRTENGYMLCSDGLRVFRQTQITCCPICGKRLEVEP